MAQTQQIHCIACGKTIGVVDATNGNFNSIKYNKQWDKDEQIIAKEGENFTIKKAASKAGHRKDKEPAFAIADGQEVICSCGQVNKII